MIINISTSTAVAQNSAFRVKLQHEALQLATAYNLSASDLILDAYLQKQFNIGLKQACIYLILRCSIISNLMDSITIIFRNSNDDRLARLITHGTGPIKGSNILRKVFIKE